MGRLMIFDHIVTRIFNVLGDDGVSNISIFYGYIGYAYVQHKILNILGMTVPKCFF